MGDGKPKHEAATIAAAQAGRRPTVSQVRQTVIAGDKATELSPESLAGTIGVADTVLTSEQLAAIAGVDRYMPMRELGRGGMGRVDVIYDRALGRPVARKMVLEGRHLALLVAEAQICAQLEHPSIVPVYDIGTDAQGNPHYTMRVIHGRTLRNVLDDNDEADKPHMGLTPLLNILRQVCLAVEYAHTRGVVHRDLKPENIIVGEFGEVYVLDWGVAFVTEDSDIHRATPKGTELSVAGSPGYMAPEQAMGEPIQPRTDVFALGVMLYEILTGSRPFDDKDLPSIIKRIAKRSFPPPSMSASGRSVPPAFDDLVRSCLQRSPADRPPSARWIADAVDAYLDGERIRLEREREASVHAQDGDRARDAYELLETESHSLRDEAERLLGDMQSWESPERKQPAWTLAQEAKRLASEAARALARAEAAFTRALGRVRDHPAARAGLADLYFRQFQAAENQGDREKMAQYLDLARTYDDGALALQLADQGRLAVAADADAELVVSRYEASGLLLTPTPLGVSSEELRRGVVLECGSYVVAATLGAREVRFPVVIVRAAVHRIELRMATAGSVPADMLLVPGGPYLASPPRANRLITQTLPDFAIRRLPVTFLEYTRFLDAIEDPEERTRRTPGHGFEGGPLLVRGENVWRTTPRCIEGKARQRVPEDRELSLPVNEVSWYDATAYARWLSRTTGLALRLPTDLEWDKAMRGADGRAFPMGNHLDPSFAKLRESRPEATQLEPVGAFPLDESPYGVRDLAGGVGDWTSTSADGEPLPDLSDEGTPHGDERQAYWRGGNWGSSATARAMRYPMKLTGRTPGVGFRLALSLDQDGSSDLTVEPMKRS